MKKQSLKKIAVASVLLAFLFFSLLPFNLLFVNADAVGVGKFLTVEIVGEGNVTATKVKSGEMWTYTKTDPPTEHKLGAGTVSIRAYASEGWRFSHWEVDLTGIENPVDYKSEKYGYVRAVFQKVIFTITALVSQDAPNGTIETYGDGVSTPIEGGLSISIEYGGNQTFQFNPFADNHVSALQVDDAFIPYTLNYSFKNVQVDHTLAVYFSADGQAYIPAGSNLPVYLGDNVGLTFTATQGGGTATQYEVVFDAHPDLNETSLILWDIKVDANFTGWVEITLPYVGTQNITKVWTSDSLDALYSDVNGDGYIDGDDVSDVAVGIKTTVSSGAEYNAQFDINRDGELTEEDVHLVNQYKGTTLQNLSFSVVGSTLLVQTDHFTIFRAR